MSSEPSSTLESTTRSGTPPLVLAEATTWRKYSPHYELPLSTVTSILVHGLGLLIIMLFGAMLFQWGTTPLIPIDTITLGDEGGSGLGSGGLDMGASSHREAAEFELPDEPVSSIPSFNPKELPPRPPTPNVTLPDGPNVNSDGKRNDGSNGPGVGNKTGPGVGKDQPSKRERRKDRWVLSFSFRSGEEYLNRLAELGAIVVIPEGTGKFRIFDDLTKRPLAGRAAAVDDVRKLNRIYWRDSNPEAVEAIASALGLKEAPEFFWAFFPQELEKELLAKELAYKGLTEDEIVARKLETVFAVERQGKTWMVRVIEQKKRPDPPPGTRQFGPSRRDAGQ